MVKQLEEMGFEQGFAEIALEEVGFKGLEQAIEWLEKNKEEATDTGDDFKASAGNEDQKNAATRVDAITIDKLPQIE